MFRHRDAWFQNELCTTYNNEYADRDGSLWDLSRCVHLDAPSLAPVKACHADVQGGCICLSTDLQVQEAFANTQSLRLGEWWLLPMRCPLQTRRTRTLIMMAEIYSVEHAKTGLLFDVPVPDVVWKSMPLCRMLVAICCCTKHVCM